MPSLPQQHSPSGSVRPRVAYLLSRYPAISHTFFLKEVLGLRERGMEIHVASINPPDRPRQSLPEVEAEEADHTYYVKSSGMASLALQVFGAAMAHPAVTLRGLAAALKMGGWDLKARAFALFYLAEALLVGRWMRQRSLNHLHVHFGGPVATVGMLAAEAWGIPWSITLHGPDEFFDQEAFYLRSKIRSATFILCISDFCRSQVLRIVPDLPWDRVDVVRLGVDCEALKPAPGLGFGNSPESASPGTASSSASTRQVRLVCTGRLVAAKGQRILLEALAPLVAAGNELHCTLVGDGAERAYLEEFCRRQGIEAQVSFTGSLSHSAALEEVAKADVFVLASFAEGLPVALMEAMALGVPCVSTTIAAIPELIQSGENGMLVPPANVEALRAVLGRMASDAALRGRLGERARATVETNYNLSRNLDLLADVWSRRLGE